jgi:K(+)-stimulated pyrophosphate-energized sodium pump
MISGLALALLQDVDPNEIAKFDIHDKVWAAWLVAPIGAIVALVFAWVFYRQMLRADPGTERMQKIAAAVRAGAFAYLKQQYKVVAIVFVVLMAILFVLARLGYQHWLVGFAFLTGGFFSGLCGFLGMNTATLASSRTAQAASESLNRGLTIAFRSGAVMGLVVVGLALIDIVAWFFVLNNVLHFRLQEVTYIMLAFGMGASTQALFARVGGGIYTKAADVGSDLVGKTELNIPEDDPRNPATIADNVGDNVGDVAGMGADLYESYAGSILATALLGFATAQSIQPGCTATQALPWVVLPMVIAGIGNILSVIGIYAVRTGEEVSLRTLMAALFRGINLSTVGIAVIGYAAAWFLLGDSQVVAQSGKTAAFGLPYWAGVGTAVLIGLLAGWIIGKATEYYTSNDFRPTQELAGQAPKGYGPVIIDGVALGMLSTVVPVVTVVAGTFLAFLFTGGFDQLIQGLYGVALAAVGMLSTLGITLATDAYGPIADNAGGNAQMSHLPPHVRERTDALDALGNTTAATGKGFAIGSAALTALALFAGYVIEVQSNLIHLQNQKTISIPSPHVPGGRVEVPTAEASITDFMRAYDVTPMNPAFLLGLLLGAMMVFAFCALTMKAVGRAAGEMVEEVRRQWREIPGVADGTADPDYAACVAIATKGAQKKMIAPSLAAIIVPIVVSAVLGVPGVMGLLAGTVCCGFVTAIMMAAAGGAWDNAKKWIEMGRLKIGEKVLGKGSDAHKAAVVGDTVGDPFKDTSGPSLNILIKLMSMVSVVFVGVAVAMGPRLAAWLESVSR